MVDWVVGEIVQATGDAGQIENTIIVFTSERLEARVLSRLRRLELSETGQGAGRVTANPALRYEL